MTLDSRKVEVCKNCVTKGLDILRRAVERRARVINFVSSWKIGVQHRNYAQDQAHASSLSMCKEKDPSLPVVQTSRRAAAGDV
jgi:hypothetical protein